MSSTVFVIDSSFKRTQVKVSPGTPLRDVLEEACRTRKLRPDGYTLKTQSNKIVDLSQPFRLSGLTAGAKLQLIQGSRSPSVVTIALQLPETEGGGRLSDKFASTTSLWVVLRKYEDGVAGSPKKLNLTQRGAPSASSGSGRLLYEQPCINLMGRSLENFEDLQKTLAQLGLTSGNVLLRLSFKLTEKPLEEAMLEISGYFEASDAQTSSSDAEPLKLNDEGPSSASRPAEVHDTNISNSSTQNGTEDMDGIAEAKAKSISAGTSSPGHPTSETTLLPDSTINGISVYSAPTSSTPAAALQPDDQAVFEPTVDHAKAHQAALQRAGKNQRLLSDKELEEQDRQRQEQLAAVQTVIVRVRYPDQLMIETQIKASESAAQLYSRVRQTLSCSNEPFELRYHGSKGQDSIPESESVSLVRNLGFRGRVLVNFAWSATASAIAWQSPSLKEEYRAHAMELKVELASQQADTGSAQNSVGEQKASQEKKPQGSKLDVEAKLKKFMGFGRK